MVVPLIHTVKPKHRKTLTRRLKYLEGLGKAGNSYDEAEIAALRHVIDIFDILDSVEDMLNIRTLVALDILRDQYFDEDDEAVVCRDYLADLTGDDAE